jgi:hypothetical protein
MVKDQVITTALPNSLREEETVIQNKTYLVTKLWHILITRKLPLYSRTMKNP